MRKNQPSFSVQEAAHSEGNSQSSPLLSRRARPSMLGKLVVIAGPDQGQTFELAEGGTLTLGRGQQTDSKFKDPHVSRKHCEVSVQNGKVLLIDAGSSSGTLVGDKRITQHTLRAGETFRIGGTEIRFVPLADVEATTMAP